MNGDDIDVEGNPLRYSIAYQPLLVLVLGSLKLVGDVKLVLPRNCELYYDTCSWTMSLLPHPERQIVYLGLIASPSLQ